VPAKVASDFLLLGDQPHTLAADPLGFEEIVDGLAELILESREATPFTFGIEGTWGTGKSTLMGALRRRLTENPEVTGIQFNAWTAQEGQVLEAFVKTVLSAIKPRYLRNALYRRKAIGLLRFGLSALAGLVGQSRTVDRVWDAVASDPQVRNELRDLLQVTVAAWRKSSGTRTRLLCVFVDDLDRCEPKVVVEVLEAMKLYLDVPGLVFVVGYDEGIVSEVVLRDKGYSDKTKARDYLEKFIQISYRIPPAPERQSQALIAALLESSGTSQLLGEVERRLVIEGSASNPRSIKRFINRFVLVYGLNQRWREVEPQGLVRALLLQIYFPEFARLLERPQGDPVEEFLEYAVARDILLREAFQSDEREQADRALLRYRLPTTQEGGGRPPKELLQMLDERVRVEFPELAAREEFVTLLRDLSQGSDWETLRSAFSQGELAEIDVRDAVKEPFWLKQGFEGLRVLWVDDQMTENRDLVTSLEALGAYVESAADGEEMWARLEKGRFDVLVSDIGRGSNPQAGFEELERAQHDGVLELPARLIFFTRVITSERESIARRLGAKITNEAEAMFNFLAASPRGET